MSRLGVMWLLVGMAGCPGRSPADAEDTGTEAADSGSGGISGSTGGATTSDSGEPASGSSTAGESEGGDVTTSDVPTCRDDRDSVRAGFSLELGDWPGSTDGEIQTFRIDTDCVFSHEANTDAHLYYFDCPDEAGSLHSLVLSLDVSPPAFAVFEVDEPVHLFHVSTRPLTFPTSTVVRAADGTLRLIAHSGDASESVDAVAYAPFSFSITDEGCASNDGTCGDPQRTAVLIEDGAGGSMLIPDDVQVSAILGEGDYVATVEGAQYRPGHEQCDPSWEFAAAFVLVRTGAP